MTNYYFCAYPMVFGHSCQVIPIHSGDDLGTMAENWAKANGYKDVWVYTMDYDFVWKF